MFTITKKLRTIIALSAVGATLAGSGVASAAMVVQKPGAGTPVVGSRVASAAMVVQKPGTGTPVVASQPTIVAQYIDPNKVGSAGIPGYDNAMCESLAEDHNKAESAGILAVQYGDASAAQANVDNANGIQSDLEQNCLVID